MWNGWGESEWIERREGRKKGRVRVCGLPHLIFPYRIYSMLHFSTCPTFPHLTRINLTELTLPYFALPSLLYTSAYLILPHLTLRHLILPYLTSPRRT